MPRTRKPGKPKGMPRGGSRKGVPNKVGVEVKAMVLRALALVGGDRYLAAQAVENAPAFLALLGKLLPKQLSVDPDGGDLVVRIVSGVPERKITPVVAPSPLVRNDSSILAESERLSSHQQSN